MRTSLLSLLLVVTGCNSVVQPECQMMPSAQGGYVIRFTRTAAAAAGCDSDADCDPFTQPFSSGIFSPFDQGCHKDTWTAPVVAYLNDANGTSFGGVCFLNKPYPSLK